MSVLQGVHAVLEEASHSCNHWTQLSESVEQQVTGLNGSIEVLRVTALAQKQKGEAGKPALALLERTVADLQAQLAGEQKSHRLTQVSFSSAYSSQGRIIKSFLLQYLRMRNTLCDCTSHHMAARDLQAKRTRPMR